MKNVERNNTLWNFKYQTMEALALRARMRVPGQTPAWASGQFFWPAENSVCQMRPTYALLQKEMTLEGKPMTNKFAICSNFRTATPNEDLARGNCLPSQAVLYGEDVASIAVDDSVELAEELETGTLNKADQLLLASVKSPFGNHVSNFIRHGAFAMTSTKLIETEDCDGFRLYHYSVSVPDPRAALAFGVGYAVTLK